MVLLESLPSGCLIPVPIQPVGYLFEVPPIIVMEFTDDIIQLLLVRSVGGYPQVGTGQFNQK